ncbi:MAG TPA: 4Fe-4S binding protein [Longilinea sp.]|nr:4Fe-4S binding protein [Longilinea sp.]
MNAKINKRQSIRRALILLSLLLFPVVLNYLSPYVIIDGAMNGVINGSFLMFGLLFISSLFLGRAWCGWACPAAGLTEACIAVNNKPAKAGWRNYIKWGIWVVWLSLIVFIAISNGGYTRVDPFYLTDHGISVTAWQNYIIYYGVIGLAVVLSFTAGKRAFCHYVCWMAPFMILGRKLRNLLHTPALHLQAETPACKQCSTCDRACPMSLPVSDMVQKGKMENSECILCGNCVDGCPSKVISYTFNSK